MDRIKKLCNVITVILFTSSLLFLHLLCVFFIRCHSTASVYNIYNARYEFSPSTTCLFNMPPSNMLPPSCVDMPLLPHTPQDFQMLNTVYLVNTLVYTD